MALNPPAVAELYGQVKNLLEIWMRLKLAIQKAFGKNPVGREHEEAFLKLKSEMSRNYRTIHDRLPKELQFKGDEMLDMMKNATTMEHLQSLPVTEKRTVFSRWHDIYVLMSRTFGALEVMNEGYYPRLHRDLLKLHSSDRGKGKKRGKMKTRK